MESKKFTAIELGLLFKHFAYYIREVDLMKPSVKADFAEMDMKLSAFRSYIDDIKALKIDVSGLMEGSMARMKAEAYNKAIDDCLAAYPMEE